MKFRQILDKFSHHLDNAKKTLFNFTGMSFKDYIKSFNERLNDEIKAIVELFIL